MMCNFFFWCISHNQSAFWCQEASMTSAGVIFLWAWVIMKTIASPAILPEITDKGFMDECVREHNRARSSVVPAASDMLYMVGLTGINPSANLKLQNTKVFAIIKYWILKENTQAILKAKVVEVSFANLLCVSTECIILWRLDCYCLRRCSLLNLQHDPWFPGWNWITGKAGNDLTHIRFVICVTSLLLLIWMDTFYETDEKWHNCRETVTDDISLPGSLVWIRLRSSLCLLFWLLGCVNRPHSQSYHSQAQSVWQFFFLMVLFVVRGKSRVWNHIWNQNHLARNASSQLKSMMLSNKK